MESEIDNDAELPSKTQLKQEATDLQLLGKQLTTFTPATLKKLPVTEILISAITEFNRLPNNHGARRRQLQFIGKLMRDLDYNAIMQAISDLKTAHLKKKKKPSTIAFWRDRILLSGDDEINAIVELYPHLERQAMRQLYLEYNRCKESNREKFKSKLQIYLQQHIVE